MCFIIFCAFFLPSCHSTLSLSPSSLPLFPFPPSLLPSLLSVLSPSPIPPFFFSSFSPFFFPSSASSSSFPSSLPPSPSSSSFLLLLPSLPLFFPPSLPSSLPPFLPLFYPLSPSLLPSSLPLFLPLSLCRCFITRNVFEFFPRQLFICPLYQVVVFQLIERSLLLPLHRLSACELGFFPWNFILLIRFFVSAIFFTRKQLLVGLVPTLKAREKSRPSFPSYFTQNLRHSNL